MIYKILHRIIATWTDTIAFQKVFKKDDVIVPIIRLSRLTYLSEGFSPTNYIKKLNYNSRNIK